MNLKVGPYPKNVVWARKPGEKALKAHNTETIVKSNVKWQNNML